jgi:myo-inositol-1(or 4)-monophosphatase
MTVDRLQLATDLARRAGEMLLAGYGDPGEVRTKSTTVDLVTQYDLESEAFLLAEIHAAFPQDAVLSEETGPQGSGNHCWVIDPLDGTTNFAHALPIFSVSIACLRAGEPALGVVYAPVLGELFSASSDGPAQLNGDPIEVSSQDNLGSALMVTGFPYDVRQRPDNNLDHYRGFALRTLGVRRLGSAALDLCYVAAGRFDGYWEVETHPWDFAAGALIAQRAGALVSQINGRPPSWRQSCSIVASNPGLHPKILEQLARPAV